MPLKIKIQRLYDPDDDTDSFRVLVDRVWPRGVSKEELDFDLWCKSLAPTAELRKWFGHKAENWATFCERYRAELRTPEQIQQMKKLLEQAGDQQIILLYGAKDTEHNQAVVLARELEHVRQQE